MLCLNSTKASLKVDIMTRTYYKDSDILYSNLISTLNLFVNRDVFKFVILLDDENEKNHELGDKILNNSFADKVFYLSLPENHENIFQGVAFGPNYGRGYDRQQYDTFFFDRYSDATIIGAVDSDSTFVSYMTMSNILTKSGKIKLHVISPKSEMNLYNCIFGEGSQYCNDKIALGVPTPYDAMITDRMPIFFWRSTFTNCRKYISDLHKCSFEDAFKIFSKDRYSQFNILANYAIIFEPHLYEVCNENDQFCDSVSVAQNGCPNNRDIMIGGVRSFNVFAHEIPFNLEFKGHLRHLNTPVELIDYSAIKSDCLHLNNDLLIFNRFCSPHFVNKHYSNVRREIRKLDKNYQKKLKKNFLNFLYSDFKNIKIK